jgi:hypothetical protein
MDTMRKNRNNAGMNNESFILIFLLLKVGLSIPIKIVYVKSITLIEIGKKRAKYDNK